MNQSNKFNLLILLPLLFNFSQVAIAAVDCSQESIAFYLEKGFSQEQITRMCSEPQAGEAKPSEPFETEIKQPQQEMQQPAPMIALQQQDASLYLQLAIEAEGLKVSPEMISYQREECFEKGDPDLYAYNERACAVIFTEIKVPGLEIVRAEKGNFLFVDKELVIKSEISRKVANIEDLSNTSIKVLEMLLDKSPAEIKIPLRDGFEPLDVAARLKKL